MKAIGYLTQRTVEEQELQDIELPLPSVSGHDLLVEVKAISVNPVDYKIHQSTRPPSEQWKILGWDAAGVVTAIGDQVQNFNIGDEVYYAGDLTRQGTNMEFHLVDERIVGRKPKNLDFAQSAALPLTSITAWEMLFDRLCVQHIRPHQTPSILIIGAAGGVGSIAIQLLKAKTNLTIIATASRPETQAWVKELGADYVINHHLPLAEQITALGLAAPSFVFSTTHTESYLPQIVKLIAPQGHIGFIDDPKQLDIMLLKSKSISAHWEMMFTRSLFQTPDMQQQGELLNELADMIEQTKIRSTIDQVFGNINAENLRTAHALLKQGTLKGKLVLAGF